MEKDAEKFLQAEETAVQLVETLTKLHNEATSYQNATNELDIVRQELLNLINSTEKIVSGSQEVINVLKEIGPKILDRITDIENKLNEESTRLSKGINNLKILIITVLASSTIAVIIGIIALLR